MDTGLYYELEDCEEISNLSTQSLVKQPFDYYVVLDFEATCSNNRLEIKHQEIIEFPSVLLNAETLQIEKAIRFYIKPVAHPKLTPFCTELTGIEQEWVDKGREFIESFEEYNTWLRTHLIDKGKTFAFVTCGDWDLKTMLPVQCSYSEIKFPSYFDQWINIKIAYGRHFNIGVRGMTSMLDHAKLKLEGRHHSGLDDCKNIARCLRFLLQDGSTVDITTVRGQKPVRAKKGGK